MLAFANTEGLVAGSVWMSPKALAFNLLAVQSRTRRERLARKVWDMCATFYYSFKAEAVPNQIDAANGSASIHDSASITGSASKQTRVLTGACGTESNPNAAKQNHGTTFSLETEPTFIKCWMPWGNAFHFSHDSSSIHDSTSHERTRAQAEPQNEVEPSGPPQAQAEPWLPHRPNKLFSSRPDKATGRPGRN